MELAPYFDTTRENSPGPDIERIDRLIALPGFLWVVVHGGS